MRAIKTIFFNLIGVSLILLITETTARVFSNEESTEKSKYHNELKTKAYLDYPNVFTQIYESSCVPPKILADGTSGAEVRYARSTWSCPGLTVKQGKRVTFKSPENAKRSIHIYGGSTVWGTGSDDKHTIPSYLQKSLNEENLGTYKVINHGFTSLVIRQQLEKLLASPPNHGDIVVFYDGGNDVVQRGIYNKPNGTVIGYNRENKFGLILSNLRYSLSKHSALYKLLAKAKNSDNYLEGDAKCLKAKALINTQTPTNRWQSYFESALEAKTFSESRGAKFFHFYQPTLNNTAINNYNKSYLNSILSATNSHVCFAKITSSIASKLASTYNSRSNEFNGTSLINVLNEGRSENGQHFFIDWIHVTPKANEIISHAIFHKIKRYLEKDKTLVREFELN